MDGRSRAGEGRDRSLPGQGAAFGVERVEEAIPRREHDLAGGEGGPTADLVLGGELPDEDAAVDVDLVEPAVVGPEEHVVFLRHGRRVDAAARRERPEVGAVVGDRVELVIGRAHE